MSVHVIYTSMYPDCAMDPLHAILMNLQHKWNEPPQVEVMNIRSHSTMASKKEGDCSLDSFINENVSPLLPMNVTVTMKTFDLLGYR